MTKLKTLKDLERKQSLDSFICINPIELRQEAIKDIKLIQYLEDNPLDKAWEIITGQKIRYSEEAKSAVISYIMWKFNITEEDLK